MKPVFAIMFLCAACASAEPINVERLVNAIGRAENSTNHPYGIMRHYEHTTARQACVNTVTHQLRDWQAAGSHGDFVDYLAVRYAPPGASNDPHHLNFNWAKNVKFFYAHPARVNP